MKYKIWLMILKKCYLGRTFFVYGFQSPIFALFVEPKSNHSLTSGIHDGYGQTDGIGKATSEKRPLGTLTEASLSAAKLAQKYLIIPPNDPTQHPEKKKLLRKITKFIRHVLFPFLSLEISHRVGKRLKKSHF